MLIRFSTLLAAGAALALLGTAGAGAQTTRKPVPVKVARASRPVVIAEMSDALARRPLVIQKRSFLDPGNAVPVGQDTPAYVVYNTTQHRQVYSSYNTAFFGNSELPDRFDLPPTNPRWNPSAQPRLPFELD